MSYPDSKSLTNISALVMHEAQMCEIIKHSPHPDVAKDYGCLVDEDGRISSLCFARYGKTVSQKVKDGDDFDRKKCLENIKAEIEHLHALVNPHNVFGHGGSFVIGTLILAVWKRMGQGWHC